MESEKRLEDRRRFYFLVNDWTWWAWTLTAILLTIGLFGSPLAFVVAMVVTFIQGIALLLREKNVLAFSVQLRIAYFMLLGICYVPSMRWLYWLPMVGTFALAIFGYCLLARVLSLFPWNRQETLSADLIFRTILSRPDLSRLTIPSNTSGCAGGLCTIETQVAPRTPATS